jgi:hypothetical protein
MKFTDDDLKRLKEMIVAYDPRLKLPYLIARLEAAERCIEQAKSYIQPDIDKGTFTLGSYEVWRKAKGE